MRNYLKRTGIAAVILIAIGAITFLPKHAAQWTVFAALIVWGIVSGTVFCINRKELFKSASFKRAAKKAEKATTKESDRPLDFKYSVLQLSHRITDKLHSVYPDSSWQWTDRPTAKLFTDGGRIRISTMNTAEFEEADILLDTIGRIDIKMLRASGISDIIKKASPNADTEFTIDPKVWYEQRGKQALTNIIAEQNSQGIKSLSIDEEGNVTLENSRQVDTLDAFPTKNLWKKLIELFEEEQLTVVETENSIQLSW